MASPKLQVLIIGAGLGGLAAAIAITRAGHSVTILEQTRDLTEVGAGIQVPPNATRILDRWGLLPALTSVAVAPSSFILRTWRTGAVLSRATLPFQVGGSSSASSRQEEDSSPHLLVHRADYQRILAAEAVRLGVRILLNHAVVEVDFTAPTVTTSTGTRFRADVVLCADGLHSASRARILRHPTPPRPTGDCAYRIVLPTSRMQASPRLRGLLEPPDEHFWLGPRAHVVAYPLRARELYNLVLCCPDDLPDGVRRAAGAAGEMRAVFAGWDPVLREMLALVGDESVEKWRLMDVAPLSCWRDGESGRVALLGDACHATLPYLAQGAALAVEDGAALGLLLGRCQEPEEVPAALEAYERIRQPRTRGMVEASRELRDRFSHLPDGEAQRVRDRLLREDRPGPGFPSPWKDPVLLKWLFGYDVEREMEAALEQSMGATEVQVWNNEAVRKVEAKT